jgi:hypothetical protein
MDPGLMNGPAYTAGPPCVRRVRTRELCWWRRTALVSHSATGLNYISKQTVDDPTTSRFVSRPARVVRATTHLPTWSAGQLGSSHTLLAAIWLRAAPAVEVESAVTSTAARART